MSTANGQKIIRIGNKGKATYAIGETGPPFLVDVIVTQLQWYERDAEFRDAEGKIPREGIMAYNHAAWEFVKGLCGHDITLAEAWEFLARIAEESARLKDFFEPRLPEKPSSPASTELTFSE